MNVRAKLANVLGITTPMTDFQLLSRAVHRIQEAERAATSGIRAELCRALELDPSEPEDDYVMAKAVARLFSSEQEIKVLRRDLEKLKEEFFSLEVSLDAL